MGEVKAAAAEFLKHKRIAVTGVSRKPETHGANVVYRRLKERGYEVFAVNPHATEVEGDRCYPSLSAIPGGVEAVVLATNAQHAVETIRECAELGIKSAWMHRSMGEGSVNETAADFGREHGIQVIVGGCPLMYGPTADFGHKVMKAVVSMTKSAPHL